MRFATQSMSLIQVRNKTIIGLKFATDEYQNNLAY